MDHLRPLSENNENSINWQKPNLIYAARFNNKYNINF